MSGTEKCPGVIFDLDGVLVDTGWAHKQSWYDLAEEEGFEMDDEFFYQTFGMQNKLIIPKLLGPGVSEEEIERLSHRKEQRYRQIIVESLKLSEEVGNLLADLRQAGFKMAVGSSAPRANLELLLERLEITDYFQIRVTAEDVTNSKPDPETFLTAASKLSVEPGCCVVVEDAVQGVQAGKSASMAVIAVTSTRKREDLSAAGADLVVDSLGELTVRDFERLLGFG